MTELQKETTKAIVNIFESGRIRGNYGAVAVLKGDSGHLSYGRSQTTLGSGSLFGLLERYCQSPSAQFASDLSPSLSRFKVKDLTLDSDSTIKDILKRAGSDPVMQAVQDQFFDENYFVPATRAAVNAGVQTALGQAVIYDSHIQGAYGLIRSRVPGLRDLGGEQAWVNRYVQTRRDWLLSRGTPLPATVYRMDTFADLMSATNWELTLPIVVRGVELREDLLSDSSHHESVVKRTLSLTNPWMRGDDVLEMQNKLNTAGFTHTPDGVYGPFTDALVKQFQLSKGISEPVVGPLTRQALGI